MKPRDLKYFIKRGISGITSNWLMSLASVSIVIASLTVFGIFIIFGLNMSYISDQIEQQCQINVYVSRDTSQEESKEVGKRLEKLDNVKSVKAYSKEERYENYKNTTYSDNSESIEAMEDDNPLRDSYVLTLEDASEAASVISAASKVKGVEEVKNSLDLINKIVSITKMVRTITIWLVIILIVIAVFIISNTIKLGMFSRRKEINIMKFVGATNWYIRWPFIIEGMLLGFIGALLAAVIVLLGYEAVYKDIAPFFGAIKIINVQMAYKYVLWSFVGLGTVIGMLGSYTSIRKYLHV